MAEFRVGPNGQKINFNRYTNMGDRFEEADNYEDDCDLPACTCCGYTINQEEAIFFNGDWYCEDCEDRFQEKVRDYYLESLR